LLPKLLKELSQIPDPRQPKKVKHKLTVVLLYGLLSFVLQMASRREANRELNRPAFLATLQGLFPELESLPHADTLAAAVAGDRGAGLGRDACGVGAALDPQQEIPSLLDQPVLPDCHRWDARHWCATVNGRLSNG
jgi:hypothetical protein